jgi:hypothetical protein
MPATDNMYQKTILSRCFSVVGYIYCILLFLYFWIDFIFGGLEGLPLSDIWTWLFIEQGTFTVVSFYFALRRPPFRSKWASTIFFICYIGIAVANPVLTFGGGYCLDATFLSSGAVPPNEYGSPVFCIPEPS